MLQLLTTLYTVLNLIIVIIYYLNYLHIAGWLVNFTLCINTVTSNYIKYMSWRKSMIFPLKCGEAFFPIPKVQCLSECIYFTPLKTTKAGGTVCTGCMLSHLLLISLEVVCRAMQHEYWRRCVNTLSTMSDHFQVQNISFLHWTDVPNFSVGFLAGTKDGNWIIKQWAWNE